MRALAHTYSRYDRSIDVRLSGIRCILRTPSDGCFVILAVHKRALRF